MEMALSEVCDFINGGAWSENEYADSGIYVVKVSNIENGTIVPRSDDNYLPHSKYDQYKKHQLQTDDVVVATVGSHPTQPGSVVGRTAIIPRARSESFLNQNAVCLRVKRPKLCNQRFLFYLSKTILFKHHIESRARGSANQVRMAVSELKKFTTDYPAIEIQQKAAAILSAYDELIENNKRRIALLEELAEEIYREWFVRFRFPGYRQTASVKGLPRHWQQKAISSFAQCQYGYTESATLDTSLPKFLRVMDINKASFISWSEVPNCHIPDAERQKYQLSKGDLVIARMADPGKVAIIEQNVDAVFASYLIKIAYDAHQITPYYLFYTLRTESYLGYFRSANSGATRGSINGTLIANTKVVVPNRDLLDEFECTVGPIRAQLNTLVRQNEMLSQTRDLLLSRLLSGKLSLGNLDIRFPPGMTEELTTEEAAVAHA